MTLTYVYPQITYALSGHDLNVAIIFSSLQLFNVCRHPASPPPDSRRLQIIRLPLLLLPMVLNILAETLVALRRISKFLLAEDLPEPSPIDWHNPDALQVDGSFT